MNFRIVNHPDTGNIASVPIESTDMDCNNKEDVDMCEKESDKPNEDSVPGETWEEKEARIKEKLRIAKEENDGFGILNVVSSGN